MPSISGFLNVAGAIAQLAEILDSAVKSSNARKAASIRGQIDSLLAENNYKISQLRSELERKNVAYNQLVDNLRYASAVGSGRRLKLQADKEIGEATKEANARINKMQRDYEQYAAIENEKANKLENTGILDSIGTSLEPIGHVIGAMTGVDPVNGAKEFINSLKRK